MSDTLLKPETSDQLQAESGSSAPICYAPESAFRREGNLVYNLKHHGWRKGEEQFENDVAVRVEARHLPQDVQDRIGEVIATALNREFLNA